MTGKAQLFAATRAAALLSLPSFGGLSMPRTLVQKTVELKLLFSKLP
jgi:hypothetical protein